MSGTEEHRLSALAAVSNAMIKLHKEQFGRGPSNARSHFAGSDALMCTLEDPLLPAERKMVEMGDPGRVRDSRVAFQAATQAEFIAAVEEIVDRKVVEEIVDRKVMAFASAVDPEHNTVFECFRFEPRR